MNFWVPAGWHVKVARGHGAIQKMANEGDFARACAFPGAVLFFFSLRVEREVALVWVVPGPCHLWRRSRHFLIRENVANCDGIRDEGKDVHFCLTAWAFEHVDGHGPLLQKPAPWPRATLSLAQLHFFLAPG